jgi:2Fe-2S ferredoxin
MAKITFIEKNGNYAEVDAPIGLSLMEIARKNNIDIEGACGGCLSCATCHVIVHPDWFEKLNKRTEDEDDMLDLAFEVKKTSRLSCQILMSEELNGIIVALPSAPVPWKDKETLLKKLGF